MGEAGQRATATASGGISGLPEGVALCDPDRLIPFAITNHFTDHRVLTACDIEVAGVVELGDGTLWIADASGPLLLHTDGGGRVLESPLQLPDPRRQGSVLRSSRSPFAEEGSAERIMYAVRAHAEACGNRRTPVFSPGYEHLRFEGSGFDSFARGGNSPPGLPFAPSDVFDALAMKQAGFPIVTWTVNDPGHMKLLLSLVGEVDGRTVPLIDGMISDRPDLLYEVVANHDGDGDGRPDCMGPDGLIDIDRFDAQGHRGGRDLRPESTLPAFEAGLDCLVTTLEFDNGIAADGVPMVSHDPYLQPGKCRRAGGGPYSEANKALIKDLTSEAIQRQFICDGLIRGPQQRNDHSLSPVATTFATKHGLMDSYVMPTTRQVFEFVRFYASHYRSGEGAAHAKAAQRWRNAARVRFNIETKINPRHECDARGIAFAERTVGPGVFATQLAEVIVECGMTERADVQSFDFRTLLHLHEHFPAIRTVFLFGDYPLEAGDEGTNLEGAGGATTPWMAGLPWPYRVTRASQPHRVARGGGIESFERGDEGRLRIVVRTTDERGGPDGAVMLMFDPATRTFAPGHES